MYGVIQAKVADFSAIPNEGSYLLGLTLPKPFITSHNTGPGVSIKVPILRITTEPSPLFFKTGAGGEYKTSIQLISKSILYEIF